MESLDLVAISFNFAIVLADLIGLMIFLNIAKKLIKNLKGE